MIAYLISDPSKKRANAHIECLKNMIWEQNKFTELLARWQRIFLLHRVFILKWKMFGSTRKVLWIEMPGRYLQEYSVLDAISFDSGRNFLLLYYKDNVVHTSEHNIAPLMLCTAISISTVSCKKVWIIISFNQLHKLFFDCQAIVDLPTFSRLWH